MKEIESTKVDALQALAQSQDGAFGVGMDQRIVFWNRSAERILGYSAEEMVGSRCYEAFTGPMASIQTKCAPNCRTIELARNSQLDSTYTIHVKPKIGGPIWVNLTHILIPSEEPGPGILVHIFQDVSTQIQAMQIVDHLSRLSSPNNKRALPPDDFDNKAMLTPREIEVLTLLISGASTSSITAQLLIDRTTTRNHIQHILSKLGAHSRIQAIAIARRMSF